MAAMTAAKCVASMLVSGSMADEYEDFADTADHDMHTLDLAWATWLEHASQEVKQQGERRQSQQMQQQRHESQCQQQQTAQDFSVRDVACGMHGQTALSQVDCGAAHRVAYTDAVQNDNQACSTENARKIGKSVCADISAAPMQHNRRLSLLAKLVGPQASNAPGRLQGAGSQRVPPSTFTGTADPKRSKRQGLPRPSPPTAAASLALLSMSSSASSAAPQAVFEASMPLSCPIGSNKGGEGETKAGNLSQQCIPSEFGSCMCIITDNHEDGSRSSCPDAVAAEHATSSTRPCALPNLESFRTLCKEGSKSFAEYESSMTSTHRMLSKFTHYGKSEAPVPDGASAMRRVMLAEWIGGGR
eukprot:365255-Chlamydomonas_euryale.AAC.28